MWSKFVYFMDIYNFHVGIFSWITFHHGEKNCSKLWKNMKFPTLRKISKFRNFDFSKWNLEFFISWWITFISLHVFMNYDLWHLILTKKSKFDFSVYNWLLISWLKNSSVNLMDFVIRWENWLEDFEFYRKCCS